jgi:hypothetical protein
MESAAAAAAYSIAFSAFRLSFGGSYAVGKFVEE